MGLYSEWSTQIIFSKWPFWKLHWELALSPRKYKFSSWGPATYDKWTRIQISFSARVARLQKTDVILECHFTFTQANTFTDFKCIFWQDAIRDVHIKGIMYRAIEADIGAYPASPWRSSQPCPSPCGEAGILLSLRVLSTISEGCARTLHPCTSAVSLPFASEFGVVPTQKERRWQL